MKDYTRNQINRKKFIEGYDISTETNELIIHKANGDTKRVIYTRENEQKIQKTMEKQARAGIRNRAYFNTKHQTYFTLTVAILFGIGWSFLSNLFHLQAFFADAALYIALGALPITLYKQYTYKKIVNDLEKMALFLPHKEEWNENVRNHQMITEGMSKNAREKIKETHPWKPVFDINNLDQYCLKDLKILRENIKVRQQYNKIPTQEPTDQMAKILKLPTNAVSSKNGKR